MLPLFTYHIRFHTSLESRESQLRVALQDSSQWRNGLFHPSSWNHYKEVCHALRSSYSDLGLKKSGIYPALFFLLRSEGHETSPMDNEMSFLSFNSKRYEFFGDALAAFLVASSLYFTLPRAETNVLTNYKVSLVSNKARIIPFHLRLTLDSFLQGWVRDLASTVTRSTPKISR